MQDSLDNLNWQANEKYSKAFYDFFQKELGVLGNRGYIAFIDPGRENMGYAMCSEGLAHMAYFIK